MVEDYLRRHETGVPGVRYTGTKIIEFDIEVESSHEKRRKGVIRASVVDGFLHITAPEGVLQIVPHCSNAVYIRVADHACPTAKVLPRQS